MAMMEGSDDVYVHKFTISLGGKTLFSDCKLSLAHGRRYGLVGARLFFAPRLLSSGSNAFFFSPSDAPCTHLRQARTAAVSRR